MKQTKNKEKQQREHRIGNTNVNTIVKTKTYEKTEKDNQKKMTNTNRETT